MPKKKSVSKKVSKPKVKVVKKKVAAPKVAKPKARKRAKKKASKIKRNIKPEHHFGVADGTTVKNLFELAESLERMSEEIFNHHVNLERNDFANWVKNIHEEHELAKNLADAEHKHAAHVLVLKHLVKKLK